MHTLWVWFVRFVLLPLLAIVLTRGCTQVEEREKADRKFILFQRNVVEESKEVDATWRDRLRAKRCDGGGEHRPAFPAGPAEPGAAGAPPTVGAAAAPLMGEPERPDALTFKLETGL